MDPHDARTADAAVLDAPTIDAPTFDAPTFDAVKFDAAGLVPAIAQDAGSGEVLMMAWMNRESLARTLATGRATYWSRSRAAFWVKGETSGHTQTVRRVSLDCDGDALLLQVEQVGAACHTGHRSCFYRDLAADDLTENAPVLAG